jgi:hypothetical protein
MTMPKNPPGSVKYEYEIFLRSLGDNPLRLPSGEDDVATLMRKRADEIRARFLAIADVVDKLAGAGWEVAEHSSGDPDFLCWRDEAPFTSEAALREHLQSIAVPVDADFLDIVALKVSEDEDDQAPDDDDDADDDADDDDDDDDYEQKERKLYLVRWQNLSAAFVMAYDENDLLDILDEESDTTGCAWWKYDGPLFLDFDLPIEWKHVNEAKTLETLNPAPEDWVPENIAITKMSDDPNQVRNFSLRLAGSDTAFAAEEKIFALAFPQLHKVFFKGFYNNGPSLGIVAEAARNEIARTMRQHRQIVQEAKRRAAAHDHDAITALVMGTSIEQVQNMNQNSDPPVLPAEQPLPPLVPPPEETGN